MYSYGTCIVVNLTLLRGKCKCTMLKTWCVSNVVREADEHLAEVKV